MLYDNTTIEKMLNSYENIPVTYSPEKYIMYGDIEYLNKNNKKNKNCNDLDQHMTNTLLMYDLFGSVTICMFHKSAFDYYTFDESLRYAEDYDLLLHLCILHKFLIHHIENPIIKATELPDGLTRTNKVKTTLLNEKLKHNVLNQLREQEREQYKTSLKKLYKKEPLRIKFRRKCKNMLLKCFGFTITFHIITIYLKIKPQKEKDRK